MKLRDNVFIVTGGGSGLGAATSRMFVAGGARVVIADINDSAGSLVAAELGERAHFVRTDIVEEDDARSAVAAALERFGRLNGLVNCAGVVVGEKIVGREGPHALASFARVISVNLVGAFNMIRLAADGMSRGVPDEEGERGVIVNTASVAAFEGQIGQAAYSASKAGIVGFTLPIARELSRYGIRVMTVAPGIFHTPMMDSLPEDVQKSLGDSVPFPSRLGRPEEFAKLVKHICENRMLNGEVIRLDGALRMVAK